MSEKLVPMQEAANKLNYHRVTLSRIISKFFKENNFLPKGVYPMGKSYRIDIEMFKENFSNHNVQDKTNNFSKLRHYFEAESGYWQTVTIKTQKNTRRALQIATTFFYNKKFNKENLAKFKDYLLNYKLPNDKNYSESTVIKILKCIGVVCKHCHDTGLLPDNFARGITKGLKAREVERFLSKEERERLRAYVTDLNVLDYIEFGIETGLRKEEKFNLTWNEGVDLEKRELYITKRKSGKSLVIPLSPLAFQILQRRRHLGKPFKTIGYEKFQKAMKEAKIEKFRWHDLRHTFATWCIKGWHSWLKNDRMPLDIIQKLVGHAKIAMTQRYAHLDASDLHSFYNNDDENSGE